METLRVPSEARYCFVVDWYDNQSAMMRKYQVIFYGADGTLEMYDIKNRRTFLKRCDYPAVKLSHLFVGGIIEVYSRQLTIVEYGDAYTRAFFESKSESTVAYVFPAAMGDAGKIIDTIYNAGLTITEMKMVSLEAAEAASLSLSGGLVLAMKLTGEGAVQKWAAMSANKGGVSGSVSAAAAAAESNFLFCSKKLPKPCGQDSSSLLLVRPHAVSDGKLGLILHQLIESGFDIAGMYMLQLTRPNAGEFFEVYKGVVPEYAEWVNEVTSGKSVVLQVMFKPNAAASVPALRELCGAHDPEIAGHLQTSSLRALYGETKTKNAVHCTDLPEDGPLEVDYFFTILASA